MSETWHERKHARSIDYWRHHGIAEETCTACSGSGAMTITAARHVVPAMELDGSEAGSTPLNRLSRKSKASPGCGATTSRWAAL